MLKFSLPFLFAIGLSVALTPLSRRLAIRIGAIDSPGERRVHAVATPRLGGPALLAALVLTMLLLLRFDQVAGAAIASAWRMLRAVALGALMVTLVGAIDDVRALRPIVKLLVELAAASVAVYGGCRIDLPALHQAAIWSFGLNVAFIVVIVNAVNLIDGLDGLAVGVGLIISAALFFLGRSSGQLEPLLMTAAMCGVLLGFLPYNFNPARIFLGDSGALLLGFMLAVAAISTAQVMAAGVGRIAPLVALGLPLTELMLTSMRRILRPLRVTRFGEEQRRYRFRWTGLPTLFSGDRDHIHHRLLKLGIGHRRVVLLLYGVCAMLCGIALGIAVGPPAFRMAILAASLVAFVIGVNALGYRELMPLRSGFLLPFFGARATGRGFQITLDVLAITSSCALAFLVEGNTDRASPVFALGLVVLIGSAQLAMFALGGLYRRAWRHAGIDDGITLMKAIALAVAAEMMVAVLMPSARLGLRAITLNGCFLAMLAFGSRLAFPALEHLFQRERGESRRVLIYGAGRAGEAALNEIRSNPDLGMRAVGFLDDDAHEYRVIKLQGITVYPLAQLAELIRTGAFDVMLLSGPKIALAREELLSAQCEPAGLPIARFEVDWQGAGADDGLEAPQPRRRATVIPIGR